MRIFDFEELFNFSFGEKDSKTVCPDIGSDRKFGIRIRTPNHSEEDVRLGIPMMAFVFNKNMMLTMSRDGVALYESNRDLSFFVNKDGVDPKPLKVRDDTHGGEEYEVPRETHLMPDSEYLYTMEDNHSSNQMAVTYYGTDVDEEDYSNGVPLPHNGVDGIWFPLG